MLCASCNAEISPSFKYAMAQNICPVCGGSIMDEETLALIENVKMTIANEAKLRDETVHKLAMALLAQYNMSFRDNTTINRAVTQPRQVAQPAEQLKVAPPSAMQQAGKRDIIKAEEIVPEGVSEKERERIMEEVVRKRYAVVDQVQSASMSGDSDEFEQETSSDALFSEGNVNPILEQERLARLAKQKRAVTGGGNSSFRRSG